MEQLFIVLLTFVLATGVMAGQLKRIIGGHNVRKRSTWGGLRAKVIATVDDDDNGHPVEQINNLIADLERNNRTVFDVDSNDYNVIDHEEQKYEVLCPYQTRMIYPTIIEDERKQRYHVLNTKKNRIQQFKVELCVSTDKTESNDHNIFGQCKYVTSTKPQSSAMCYQEYMKWPVYVLSKTDTKKYENQTFEFPSFCSCYIFEFI